MIYDNTYEWIATQGWSFLPLDNYGGGTAEAKFRPLEANSFDYDLAWAQCKCYESFAFRHRELIADRVLFRHGLRGGGRVLAWPGHIRRPALQER